MSKTPAQIRQRVGEDLGIVPIGQSLQSHHNARIVDAYDEVYERLKVNGLASWASTANVPDELVPPFALMIAEKCLTSFSVPEARYNRIKNEAGPNGDTAEANLAALSVPAGNDTTEDVDF